MSASPARPNHLWVRAVLLHPLLAAAGLLVIFFTTNAAWTAAAPILVLAFGTLGYGATIAMTLRRPDVPSRERWASAIAGLACTFTACALTAIVFEVITLALACSKPCFA